MLVAPGNRALVGFVDCWEHLAPSPAAMLAMPGHWRSSVTGTRSSPKGSAFLLSSSLPGLQLCIPSGPEAGAALGLCPPCLAPLLPSHSTQSWGISRSRFPISHSSVQPLGGPMHQLGPPPCYSHHPCCAPSCIAHMASCCLPAFTWHSQAGLRESASTEEAGEALSPFVIFARLQSWSPPTWQSYPFLPMNHW